MDIIEVCRIFAYMSTFSDSVRNFLEGKGFHCKDETLSGIDILRVGDTHGNLRRTIVLLGISARTIEEARLISQRSRELIVWLREENDPVIISEDIWNRNPEMSKGRLLAHLEIFIPVFARNCEVRRIDKSTAGKFLSHSHTYGDAACRYRYGLFLKRHTGHIAEMVAEIPSLSRTVGSSDLVAVATFSNARKWVKGDRIIRSYEWTRYASLPGVRVSGGMGKLLKAFIRDVGPDDIMSYADLEWSEGKVYETLGFQTEQEKEAVDFVVDGLTWERFPIRSGMTKNEGKGEGIAGVTGNLYFRNFGSAKYRLKLTQYE